MKINLIFGYFWKFLKNCPIFITKKSQKTWKILERITAINAHIFSNNLLEAYLPDLQLKALWSYCLQWKRLNILCKVSSETVLHFVWSLWFVSELPQGRCTNCAAQQSYAGQNRPLSAQGPSSSQHPLDAWGWPTWPSTCQTHTQSDFLQIAT